MSLELILILTKIYLNNQMRHRNIFLRFFFNHDLKLRELNKSNSSI